MEVIQTIDGSGEISQIYPIIVENLPYINN